MFSMARTSEKEENFTDKSFSPCLKLGSAIGGTCLWKVRFDYDLIPLRIKKEKFCMFL